MGEHVLRLLPEFNPFAARRRPATAAPFIGLAMFSTCSTAASRWLTAHSAFGLEFDSLADVISFGVAPALLVVFRGR